MTDTITHDGREDRAALAAEYLDLVGYDPFEDDPDISPAEVETLLVELRQLHAAPDIDDAYVISDCGHLGAETQCVQEGRAIYRGNDWEECLSAIRSDMDAEGYFPGVVYVDDHGRANSVVMS